MSRDHDVLTTLTKIRPVSAVAEAWAPAIRDPLLERVLSADPAGPVPRRSRRRRFLLTAALTAVLVPSGVGVAAAGGLLPDAFTRPLSFWAAETDGRIDAQSARRMAEMPGPDGTVLSVWSASADDGTVCIAPVFEAPGAPTRPAPVDFRGTGGSCEPGDLPQQPFGSVSGSADERGVHTMYGPAGVAVRAELRLPDGTVRPAMLVRGQFYFWYVANREIAPPVLIGYDAAGRTVESRVLPNLLTN